tara:strand:- start:163 stop:1161 length:999 start_codon:yes stop_codon:yes gene_type:complete
MRYLLLLLIVIQCLVKGVLSEFDPYADNKGTIAGIAGAGYVVMASDTRLSDSYMIRSRNIERMFSVDEDLILAGAGCYSDTIALKKLVEEEAARYKWESKKKISISGLAHLLASILFGRRSFPYFTFCAVAGLDSEGKGAIYRFDAIGSFERVSGLCMGKGEQLIQPMIDEVMMRNKNNSHSEGKDALWSFSVEEDTFISPESQCSTITKEEAIDLIVKAFKAASEREISVGDGIYIWVLDRNGKSSVSLEDEVDKDKDNDKDSGTDTDKQKNVGTAGIQNENDADATDDEKINSKFVSRFRPKGGMNGGRYHRRSRSRITMTKSFVKLHNH